jgi:hypothetical protein
VLSRSEMVSGCWERRGGINIKRTHLSVTLHVRTFFCKNLGMGHPVLFAIQVQNKGQQNKKKVFVVLNKFYLFYE